jgi:hypothetical protein
MTIREILEPNLVSRINNYAVPGLTSRLLEGWRPRVFTTERSTRFTWPHSHRYDLLSIVLEGVVLNRLWHPGTLLPRYRSTLRYDGAPGQYTAVPGAPSRWFYSEGQYFSGQHYFMTHDDIHSIAFGAKTTVLILEGPPVSDTSVILHDEPIFQVEEGLFERGE